MANVRIISRDNGVGLSRDMQLVAGLLREAGHKVEVFGYGGTHAATIGEAYRRAMRWLFEPAGATPRGKPGP